MANLTLVSPLRGWCAPLDETPDAVFAQRLLGDGVAIDPVALNGEGFEVLVAAGARVRQGDALLKFDLDTLAQRAKSVVTPIVITNGDRFSVVHARVGQGIDVGDSLLELQPLASGAQAQSDQTAQQEVTERVTIGHDHGIHARPAA